MINLDVKNAVKENLSQRRRAIDEIAFSEPGQNTFSLHDIRSGELEHRIRPWLQEALGENFGNEAIYAMYADRLETAIALKERFDHVRSEQNRGYKLPRSNANTNDSLTLYVGRSKSLHGRLKQHLWQAYYKTYALNMHRWVPDIDGSIIVIVQAVTERPNNQCIQDIEDTLWKQKLPIFGKLGSK